MGHIRNKFLRLLTAAFKPIPKEKEEDDKEADYYRSLYPEPYASGMRRRAKENVYKIIARRYAQMAPPPPVLPEVVEGTPGAPGIAPGAPGAVLPMDLGPELGAPPLEAPGVPGAVPEIEQPSPEGNVQELARKVEILERKLNIAADDGDELERKIDALEKKVKESIRYAVPERKEYEMKEYEENVYEKAVDIVDEKLDFIDAPNYDWITTKISRFNPDGSIRNGAIYVKVGILSSSGARYDITVPVHIINDMFLEPVYGEYRGDVVGLNEEDFSEILRTQSFMYQKEEEREEQSVQSMYSSQGKSMGREPEQKRYEVESPRKTTVIPVDRKWIPNKGMQ